MVAHPFRYRRPSPPCTKIALLIIIKNDWSVKAGTITQAQSDGITAKLKEMQTTRDASRDKMQSMTKAERKAAMDAEKTALEKWITDNKIPTEFANHLHMGGRGHGGPDMRGDMAPPAN